MKVLLFAASLLLFSCGTTKMIPLRGTYPPMPIQITTDKSVDYVWDKLVDLFAQKGLPIKIIDRSSGLIVSDKTVLKTTVEESNGRLQDNTSWIVVPTEKDRSLNRNIAITGTTSGVYSKMMIPRDVNGEWNVRVKKLESGVTVINVNIVNVTFMDYVATGLGTPGYYKDVPLNISLYKSTGVFEKMITDLIK